jgi:hypothetical protein
MHGVNNPSRSPTADAFWVPIFTVGLYGEIDGHGGGSGIAFTAGGVSNENGVAVIAAAAKENCVATADALPPIPPVGVGVLNENKAAGSKSSCVCVFIPLLLGDRFTSSFSIVSPSPPTVFGQKPASLFSMSIGKGGIASLLSLARVTVESAVVVVCCCC